MFLRKKLGQQHNEPTPPNPKVFFGIIIIILIVTGIMQMIVWQTKNHRTLVTQVPGFVTFESTQEIEGAIHLPDNTFEAEVFISGLYTQSTNTFPQGTVTVVYTRNNWRFVEIDYLPKSSAEEYVLSHLYLNTQEITLTQDQKGWMATVDNNTRCIDYEDDIPNRCEISRKLIFDTSSHMIIIAADGTHATDGELIEMAKSIIKNTDN